MNNPIISHLKNKHINVSNPKLTIIKLEQKQKYNLNTSYDNNLYTLNTIPQNELTNLIIEQKHESKMNIDDFLKKINTAEKEYSNVEPIWQKRTNYTYKKILKMLVENKDIKSANDLIIYKPSLSDKDYKKLLHDYNLLIELRKKYTIELAEQFNEYKREENLKKFKYSNLYINNKYNPNDASQLKSLFNDNKKVSKPEILNGKTTTITSKKIILGK